MKNTQIRAFTLVELLITITILALIAVVAFTSFGVRQNNAINSKVTSEIETLTNALLAYKQENSELPLPKGNLNFFAEDTGYVHSYSGSETYAAHGFITHDTLPKKYIDVLPIDPRTGSFYAYGKTKGSDTLDEMYEIAGVVWKSDSATSYVTGDYTAETGPYNLIRSYNGPDFVGDKSESNFPYNPLERILTAKIDDFSGTVTINGNTYNNSEILSYELKTGDTVDVSANGTVELYFSDGSRSVLGDTTQSTKLTLQKMEYKQENNLVTDIKLVLESGMIWNKAASLDDESEFEIYTTDSTAAVRGTIFGIQKNLNDSQTIVKQGAVAIQKNNISSASVSIDAIDIVKDFITTGQNESFISSPLSGGVTGLTYTDGESIIEVNENDPEIGIEVNEETPMNNSDSTDDIPTDIKDEIINNAPKFNNNINIKLKEYSYSAVGLNIQLDIPKRVFNHADVVILNDEYVIEKNEWINGSIITDDSAIIELVHSTLIDTDNSPLVEGTIIINEIESQTYSPINNVDTAGGNSIDDDILPGNDINGVYHNQEAPVNKEAGEDFLFQSFIPSFIPTTYAQTQTLSIIDYINDNNIQYLEIRFGKYTPNEQLRVTRSIKIALVEDKDYGNEEEEKKREDEIKDFEREENVFIDNRDSVCDGFQYDNINGDKEICADADDDLTIDGWNLVAYAPYDHAGDIMMYKNGSILEPYTNKVVRYKNGVDILQGEYSHHISGGGVSIGHIDPLPSYCTDYTESINMRNSSCILGGEKGIFIDDGGNKGDSGNTGGGSSPTSSSYGNDYIKYRNIDLSGDYIIEINIKGSALKELNPNPFYKNHTIISIEGKNFSLMRSPSDGHLILVKESSDFICGNFGANCNILSALDENEFYSIFIGKNSMKIAGTSIDTTYSNQNLTNSSNTWFYLGSNSDKTRQWNSIINFVKIYKK